MAMLAGIIIFGIAFVFIVIIGILIYLLFQWNIPTVILRYQGNKQRPQIHITKSRQKTTNGVSRLFVKGYKIPFRNFKSQNYYPSRKGKYGALILFEPKPGILTPVLPRKIEKKLSKEDRDKINELLNKIGLDSSCVNFEFNDDVYNNIILNAIDDTDVDFFMQEVARIDSQYTSGWRDFLMKYGGHLLVALVAVCLLAGFVVWLDKQPEMAAQCIGAAQQTSENLIKAAAGQLSSGTPPG